jgi:hypothetical protein
VSRARFLAGIARADREHGLGLGLGLVVCSFFRQAPRAKPVRRPAWTAWWGRRGARATARDPSGLAPWRSTPSRPPPEGSSGEARRRRRSPLGTGERGSTPRRVPRGPPSSGVEPRSGRPAASSAGGRVGIGDPSGQIERGSTPLEEARGLRKRGSTPVGGGPRPPETGFDPGRSVVDGGAAPVASDLGKPRLPAHTGVPSPPSGAGPDGGAPGTTSPVSGSTSSTARRERRYSRIASFCATIGPSKFARAAISSGVFL